MPAPGMLEAVGLINARFQESQGKMSNSDYKKVIEDFLMESNPIIIISALASISYSSVEIITKVNRISYAEYFNSLEQLEKTSNQSVPMYADDAVALVVVRSGSIKEMISVKEYTDKMSFYTKDKDLIMFMMAMIEVTAWTIEAAANCINMSTESYIPFLASTFV